MLKCFSIFNRRCRPSILKFLVIEIRSVTILFRVFRYICRIMPERRGLLKNNDWAGFMNSSFLNQRLIGQGHFLISPGLNSVLRAYRTNYFVQIGWVTARCSYKPCLPWWDWCEVRPPWSWKLKLFKRLHSRDRDETPWEHFVLIQHYEHVWTWVNMCEHVWQVLCKATDLSENNLCPHDQNLVSVHVCAGMIWDRSEHFFMAASCKHLLNIITTEAKSVAKQDTLSKNFSVIETR